MQRPIRTRTVIGTRPPQAPEGYVIYNAPRPIYGVEWVGDFCSGIFYTALNPDGPDFAKLHELNRQQDAVVLTFVEEQDCFDAGRARLLLRESGDNMIAILDDPANRSWIVNNQLDYLNHPKEA